MVRQPEPPDPEALMASITAAVPPNYQPLDRYQDFRAVLLGSEQGKRVLHQILSWAKMYRTSFDRDPYTTAFNEGGRNLGLMITAAISMEPQPRPERQVRTKPKE